MRTLVLLHILGHSNQAGLRSQELGDSFRYLPDLRNGDRVQKAKTLQGMLEMGLLHSPVELSNNDFDHLYPLF